jgi:hypothetical protein
MHRSNSYVGGNLTHSYYLFACMLRYRIHFCFQLQFEDQVEDTQGFFLFKIVTKQNKTKRNETKRNETKRNETKRNETKRNETKRNETKRNETRNETK